MKGNENDYVSVKLYTNAYVERQSGELNKLCNEYDVKILSGVTINCFFGLISTSNLYFNCLVRIKDLDNFSRFTK